jgi:hypothetical protein
MPEELLVTPGGARPRSVVHEIAPGHVLDGTDGRLRHLHPSGDLLSDFGELDARPEDEPLMPTEIAHPIAATRFGSGWITYASWANATGTPVSSFATTWEVPPAPRTQSGQTIFLFNGIQNSTMICQPVLQWGRSGAGGGDYWAVASWYVGGQGAPAFYSNLVRVNPGDTLRGIMTLSSEATEGLTYNCQFQGIANTGLWIQNVRELTWCIETLECYGITQCSDYPDADLTAMKAIHLRTGNTRPPVDWSTNDPVTDCGAQTNVVSNSSTDGEVDFMTGMSHPPGKGT